MIYIPHLGVEFIFSLSKIWGGKFLNHGGTPIVVPLYLSLDGFKRKIPNKHGWFGGTSMDWNTHLLSSPGEQPNSSKSADVLQPSRAMAELGRV